MSCHICLVTPGHIASTPRLVKEADALAAAGYDVHVVATRHYAPVVPFDEKIVSGATWRYSAVEFQTGQSSVVRRLARRIARTIVARQPNVSAEVAARALHAGALRLADIAAETRADYFLGHCLPGIAAAAFAARRWSRRFGCDLEDFHDAETDFALTDPAERHARQRLQRMLLPQAAHLTAAAPLIAENYLAAYGVSSEVVLNVFPLTDAPSVPIDPGPVSAENPARLYWFSQTIGPGRGLEKILAVMARMKTPTELHVRGFTTSDYERKLTALAAALGTNRPVKFLPPAHSTEMARLAAGAHIGLSLEESTPLNRDICLTNKVFTYPLAGIPQLLSNTTAQRAIALEFGDAAQLADLNSVPETAAQLDTWFGRPAPLAAARETAWQLSRKRFCWDREQENFLGSIRRVLTASIEGPVTP